MGLKQLNEKCYVFESSVNIGYVHEGTTGIIIDAGIDKSSVRKVVREIENKDLPITHLIITHAHSDHYGGAYDLKAQYGVKVIAPRFETAILQHPILEPIYLFSGNDPLDELRNKFLEGPPIEVDLVVEEGEYSFGETHVKFISTPGHSYNQMAVGVNGVLYAADSYFGEKELLKHKIPYITSAQYTLNSLHKILNTSYDGAIPGHGKYEENYKDTVKKNIEYHEELLHKLYCIIEAYPDGLSHEKVVSEMCNKMNVNVNQLSMFLLFKTGVTAYLTALIKDKKIKHYIQQNCWMFKINKEQGL